MHLLRLISAVALILVPTATFAQAKVSNLPARVGATVMAIGEQDGPANTVSSTNPLPTSDAAASSCRSWSTISPNDSVDLAAVPKAIYIGGAGDVTMIGVDAATGAPGVTWKGVPAASMLPVRPRRVLATGTTATLIVGCF